MDLLRFNADDIHELRLFLAEERRRKTPEETEREFREQVEEMRRAIHAAQPIMPPGLAYPT